jgi:hypothetical protein
MAIVHHLEDPPADSSRGAGPDPILLARGQRVVEALVEDRAHVTELGGPAYRVDAHGGTVMIIPEIVRDPYPGAVGT